MKQKLTETLPAQAGKSCKYTWCLAGATFITSLCFSPFAAEAQVIEWDKALGGKGVDQLASVKQTKDGGYIVGGVSTSVSSDDREENFSGRKGFWLVKLDVKGNKKWEKGFGAGEMTTLELTADGGYILGGTSYGGVSDDKSEPSRGETDYWIVKVDAAGNKEWDRTYGGNFYDHLTSIKLTKDGGYLLGGESTSEISGEKSENPKGDRGGPDDDYMRDYWVIKIDGAGKKQWDRTFGSENEDFLTSMEQTPDGGYLLGGSSDSGFEEGNPRKSLDFWVVKLDAQGNKEWDRLYGGSGGDELKAMQPTKDGGYLLGGYSWSPKGADKSVPLKGSNDFWIVKIDASGNKKWDRGYGGELQSNRLTCLQATTDGGFLLGGVAHDEAIGGDKTGPARGKADFWVLKVDEAGNKQWDRTLGGNNYEWLTAMERTTDGSYILGGNSWSGVSGDKTSQAFGSDDIWLVKLKEDVKVAQPELASFSPATGLPGTTVTLAGKHLKTATSVLFNGVEAKFKVVNDCKIKATVPASASTGLVEVKTAGGSVLSKEVFTVLQPSITQFAPQAGRAGFTVILVGQHLATAKKVTFNGVEATGFTVLTGNSLQVLVPEDATTGKIAVVLKGGGKAVSATDFTVRPAIGSQAASNPNHRENIAYPNPFAGEVKLKVTLEQAGSASMLILNAAGQKVKELSSGTLPAGVHQVDWDGKDSKGEPVKNGLYFYKLSVNGKVVSGKLIKADRGN